MLDAEYAQTLAHHRGQLTTLLSQLGHDPGVTDLPFLPGLAEVRDGSPEASGP